MAPPDLDDSLVAPDEASVVGCDPWLETRLDHSEDVALSPDGTLYAGGEAGQIYHIDPVDDTVIELAQTGGFVLGVTIGPDGDLYACDFQGHTVFQLPLDGHQPTGELEAFVSGGDDTTPRHPNYCVFDDAGRMYVSDSGNIVVVRTFCSKSSTIPNGSSRQDLGQRTPRRA